MALSKAFCILTAACAAPGVLLAQWTVYPQSLTCDLNNIAIATTGTPPTCTTTPAPSYRYTTQFTAYATCLNPCITGTGSPSAYVIVTVGASGPCHVPVESSYTGRTITTGVNGVNAEVLSKVGAGTWGYDTEMSTNCTGQSRATGGSPPGESVPC